MDDRSPEPKIMVTMDEQDAMDPRSRSIAEKRAAGLTQAQIASDHKISTRTVRRTLEEPRVRELVFTLQSELFSEMNARLVSLVPEAVDTLASLMRSGPEVLSARIAERMVDKVASIMSAQTLELQLLKKVEAIEQLLKELDVAV